MFFNTSTAGFLTLILGASVVREKESVQRGAQTAERIALGRVTMYPIVGYRDVGAAIAWLCRVFGFAPLEVVQAEDGGYAHVELRLGDGVIMPTTTRDGVNPENPWQGPIGT